MKSTQSKISFLFYGFMLLVCLNTFSLGSGAEQIATDPGVIAVGDNYIFETIAVPGVDFLAVTASSDFEDYAGYTLQHLPLPP